jgi:hypothetical protein
MQNAEKQAVLKPEIMQLKIKKYIFWISGLKMEDNEDILIGKQYIHL